MAKSKIEWCDYTINPIKGLCPVACDYCYARRMYKRFKWNPVIRFDDQELFALPKKPARIFVGSTMELFGPWVKPNWWDFVIQTVALYPQHTFIFLTKQPRQLPRQWPGNCWVGVSAPTAWAFDEAKDHLIFVEAPVKFISFEPLCDRINIEPGQLTRSGIKWVILGRETPVSNKVHLPWQWFEEVVEVADRSGIPVFLKDNLEGLLPRDGFIVPTNKTFYNYGTMKLRQEFPR
jgi:protein gp37